MSAGMATPRENLTLTDADLAACRPVAGEGGQVLRALCPFHGSDHQRSLRVTRASGRFQCFACGAWGYLAEARARFQDERQRQHALRRPPALRHQQPSVPPRQTRAAVPPPPQTPAPARPALAPQLAAFQAASPEPPRMARALTSAHAPMRPCARGGGRATCGGLGPRLGRAPDPRTRAGRREAPAAARCSRLAIIVRSITRPSWHRLQPRPGCQHGQDGEQ